VNNNQFKFASLISAIILGFHILIELKQIVTVFVDGWSIYTGSRFWLYYSIKEVIWRYMFDIWNVIDMSIILFWFLTLSMLGTRKDDPTLQFLCALGGFSVWAKILYFGRGVKQYSTLIEILRRIVLDMKYFILLLATFLGAFSIAFRCMKVDGTVWYSFLRVYNMMYGEFDIDSFDKDSHVPHLTLPLFILFMFMVPLILLNALIAFMGDSYGSAREDAKQVFLLSRASLIVEYETIGFDKIFELLKRLRNCCCHPIDYIKYSQHERESNIWGDGDKKDENPLMVLISEEYGIPDTTSIIGSNRRRGLKVDAPKDDPVSKIEELKQTVFTLQSQVTHQQAKMKKMIKSQSKKMANLSSGLDALLSHHGLFISTPVIEHDDDDDEEEEEKEEKKRKKSSLKKRNLRSPKISTPTSFEIKEMETHL